MISKTYRAFLANKRNSILHIQQRSANPKMTLLKAYAIITVVAVHTNGAGITYPMGNWVHPGFYYIPLFIFISGYFHKQKQDSQSFFAYAKNKAATLVLPYFIWNAVYGILNLIFRSLGVIHYGDPVTFYSFFVRPWVDGHQYHFNIASWFLLSLYLVSIITFAIRKVLKDEYFCLILSLAISLLSIYLSQKGYNKGLILCFLRAGYLLPYFQLGFLYRRFENFLRKHAAASLGMILVAMYAIFIAASSTGLGAQAAFCRFTGTPLLITGLTILSILATATVADVLSPAFEHSRIVHAIGNHTFTIMMHHGFVIFLINFAIYILNLFTEVSTFDLAKFQSTLWYTCPWKDYRIYLIYLVLGIAVPLVCKLIIDNIIVKQYDESKRL